MICEKCNILDAVPPALWCPGCIHEFREFRKSINRRQNPAPGMHCVGKFTTDESPQTVDGQCPLCGSYEIEAGYGLGSGYGCGVYNYCCGCDTFLDFSEDSGE